MEHPVFAKFNDPQITEYDPIAGPRSRAGNRVVINTAETGPTGPTDNYEDAIRRGITSGESREVRSQVDVNTIENSNTGRNPVKISVVV